MPVDTAYARLVDANPVPDVDMLRTRVEADALLLDVTEGRHVMQSEMKPIQERDRSWPANRLPAIAAGVAVVIAIAVVVLISRPSEVATTLGPIAAGEAYIAALDAHDADALRALLAPDVVFENGLADSVEDVAGIMSFYAAADWRYTSDGCAQSTIDGTMVSCEYSHQNAWMAQPRPFGSLEFVVENGRIARLTTNVINFPEWDTFSTWVRANHAADFNTIFLQSGTQPAFTPDAIVLWEQFTEEYVAEQAAGG